MTHTLPSAWRLARASSSARTKVAALDPSWTSPRAWAGDIAILGTGALGAYAGYKLMGGGVPGIVVAAIAGPTAILGLGLAFYLVGVAATGGKP